MWTKTPEELRQALSAPFANRDIEWRISATNKDKSRGLAVPYITNRAIQNRLDDTVGIDGWYNEFTAWKDGKAQLCGISIYFQQSELWLTKWDGADDSDIESVKGGLSDSMKRAAVEWGIGRYLYGMTQVWVQIEPCGKGFIIADNERPTLDNTHESWVQALQGKRSRPPQSTNQPQTQQQSGSPSSQPQTNAQGGRQPEQTTASRHKAAARSGAQTQGQSQGISNFPKLSEGFYLVRGAVMKPTVSGGSRTSVQLQDCTGQCFQAYTQGPDSRLAPGIILANVQLSSRSKDGITFYTLDAYQIVSYTAEQAA